MPRLLPLQFSTKPSTANCNDCFTCSELTLCGGWFFLEEHPDQLECLIRTGKRTASVLIHTRILLKADAGASELGWDNTRIAEAGYVQLDPRGFRT